MKNEIQKSDELLARLKSAERPSSFEPQGFSARLVATRRSRQRRTRLASATGGSLFLIGVAVCVFLKSNSTVAPENRIAEVISKPVEPVADQQSRSANDDLKRELARLKLLDETLTLASQRLEAKLQSHQLQFEAQLNNRRSELRVALSSKIEVPDLTKLGF